MALTKGKIIGIIVIILILISVIVIYSMSQSNEVTGITILNTESYSDNDVSGLKINTIIETSGTINDNAKLEILYDGSSVYSHSVSIDNNKIIKKIPWNDFAVGNKKYVIKVSYGGETSEDSFYLYNHNWAVCERVDISTQIVPPQFSTDNLNEEPKLKIGLSFVDVDGNNLHASVKDLEISLSIQYEDSSPTTISLTPSESDYEHNYFSYEYDYKTGGNYSITATVENLFVKSDTKYATVTSEPFQELINLQPLAVVNIEEATGTGYAVSVRPNTEVHFDASDSRNDGDIVAYEWDFNYENFEFTVDATGEEASYVFTERGKTYDIALRIKGDVFVAA